MPAANPIPPEIRKVSGCRSAKVDVAVIGVAGKTLRRFHVS